MEPLRHYIHFLCCNSDNELLYSTESDTHGGNLYVPLIDGLLMPRYRIQYCIYLGDGKYKDNMTRFETDVITKDNKLIIEEFNITLELGNEIYDYIGKLKHNDFQYRFRSANEERPKVLDELLEKQGVLLVGCPLGDS